MARVGMQILLELLDFVEETLRAHFTECFEDAVTA